MRMPVAARVVGQLLKSSTVCPGLAPLFQDFQPVDEPSRSLLLLLLLLVTRQSLQWTFSGQTGVFSSIPGRRRTAGSVCVGVKMHFSIPETEVCSGENGSTYVVSIIIYIYVLVSFAFSQTCLERHKSGECPSAARVLFVSYEKCQHRPRNSLMQ